MFNRLTCHLFVHVVAYVMLKDIGTSAALSGSLSQSDTQTMNCDGDCTCPASQTASICELNCEGNDACKDAELTCVSGSSCIINCIGNNACSGNVQIDASSALHVDIACNGTDSCKGNTVINCGSGNCAIYCDSRTSCEDTELYAPDATSFECKGKCDRFGYVPAPFALTTLSPASSPRQTSSPTLTSSPTSNGSLAFIGRAESGEFLAVAAEPKEEMPFWWFIVAGAVLLLLCAICCACFVCKRNKKNEKDKKKNGKGKNKSKDKSKKNGKDKNKSKGKKGGKKSTEGWKLSSIV